jgi:hypothetical protein
VPEDHGTVRASWLDTRVGLAFREACDRDDLLDGNGNIVTSRLVVDYAQWKRMMAIERRRIYNEVRGSALPAQERRSVQQALAQLLGLIDGRRFDEDDMWRIAQALAELEMRVLGDSV